MRHVAPPTEETLGIQITSSYALETETTTSLDLNILRLYPDTSFYLAGRQII